MVPPVLRQRYPQLCQNLGSVVLPQLEQQGVGGAMLEVFGGDFGDAVAGMQAGRMIRHNMQILAQCEQTIANQEALVLGLLQAVKADEQRAAASLQQTAAQIDGEKRRIFESLRQQWGVPPPAQAVPMDSYVGHAAAWATVEAQSAASTMQSAWRGKPASRPAAAAAPVAVASAVPIEALPVLAQDGAVPTAAVATPVSHVPHAGPGVLSPITAGPVCTATAAAATPVATAVSGTAGPAIPTAVHVPSRGRLYPPAM